MKMNRVLEYQNLIEMIREIDTKKNSPELVREVLDYIADHLDTFIDDIK